MTPEPSETNCAWCGGSSAAPGRDGWLTIILPVGATVPLDGPDGSRWDWDFCGASCAIGWLTPGCTVTVAVPSDHVIP